MARVKLDRPESFQFSTEISVRITDLNYGAHLGNDAVLTLVHEARVRFLKALGIENEADGFDGHGIIQADAAIVYKAEGFYGDVLIFSMACMDFTSSGFDIFYEIKKADGTLVAQAKTGLVCFDYTARKVVRISEGLKDRLSKSMGSGS